MAAARAEEMEYMRRIGVYEEADEDDCWKLTGKAPISTRWVDVSKDDEGKMVIRSRWVARDFKPRGEKDREDLFAAMPPLEAKKILFRLATLQKPRADGAKLGLLMIDVKKAHLNGRCEKDDVFVELPVEAGAKPGTCGRLRRWLYGMRPAANGWEKDYSEKLESGLGLRKGVAAPTCFWNPATGT